MRGKGRYFFILLAVTVFFSAAVGGSQAASFGGLGIRPANPDPSSPLSESWFIYNLLAGEIREDAVVISNNTEKTLSAKLYAVDATTTADGGFALLGEGEEKKSVGGWVKLERNEVTVEPGTEVVVPFEIKIPSETMVGDHLGGIVIENLEVEKNKGVNVVTRVGVRIYETVPGELIRKLTIKDFSWKMEGDKPVFYFDLANEGNVRLEPKGELVIKDGWLGVPLSKAELDLRMILPGKDTRVPVVWQKRWLAGKFSAKAVVIYGDKPGERLEREIEFWYASKVAKLALIGAGLVILVGWAVSRRKKR